MFPCEDSKTVSVCLSVCQHPEKRYHHSFVNISPTLVIDTSMKRSSRVLHHGNPKIWFIFEKVRNSKFVFWRRAEITLASSVSVLHWKLIHQWKGLHEYYTMETQKCENCSKSSKLTKLNSVRTLSFRMPRKKIALASSYISNWYVNGKVFTSTTTWEPKKFDFFFKKVQNLIRFVFWLVLKSWNHSSSSQYAPICRHRGCIVVPLRVTSMERFSLVLHHGNPKIWFFFFKKVQNSNFSFDKELKSP